MHKFFVSSAVVGIMAAACQVQAQEAPAEALAPASEAAVTAGTTRIFTPADFERFGARNALDMLNEVPGFTVRGEDGARGLGQASANVLINGERITNKSEGVFTQLQRITTERVESIEIVDGATLGIAGLSGQIANVITGPSDISGRFTYRAGFRPKYARPSFIGGEVSLSGSSETLEWTVAVSNGVGRGAAGGGEAFIFDAEGNILETREIRMQFNGDFPHVSGQVQWTSPGGATVNLNGNYRRAYENFHDNQFRDLTTGVDRQRNFENRNRGWAIRPRARLVQADQAGTLQPQSWAFGFDPDL